jgi:hypothetical protein
LRNSAGLANDNPGKRSGTPIAYLEQHVTAAHAGAAKFAGSGNEIITQLGARSSVTSHLDTRD